MKYFLFSFIYFLFFIFHPSYHCLANNGLLFYLSGEHAFTADYANGDPEPVFIENTNIISDGALGKGISCPHFSVPLAYFAPGNIYAERGTLPFFWRGRDPIGKTMQEITFNNNTVIIE